MRDAGGPGIVDFEFAWDEEGAAEILADWGESGQDAARLSLWLDFLYLIAYATFLTLAVGGVRELAGQRGWRRIAAAGTAVIAFPAAAASFDAIEDVCLLIALDRKGGDTRADAGGHLRVDQVRARRRRDHLRGGGPDRIEIAARVRGFRDGSRAASA